MRILYVSHTHPDDGAILENVGGMQRVSQQLVRELRQKKQIELQANTINAAGRGRVGLETFLFLIRQLVDLPVQVRQTQADVILFSSMVTASLAWFIRKMIPIPMVTINHGRDVTLPVGIYQWFLPKVFSSLDGVISVSQATRQECISRGMHPAKGVALPNGFDLEKLNDFPKKHTSRIELSKAFEIPLEGKYLLLSVGRQVKRKGHEWFIRKVFPKLTPDSVFVVIGDGPEFENIEQAVRESTARDRIFLLGRQPDTILKQAYAASDLFVMPNIPVEGDMEGFGIVMLEANMARTPAVASDLEGIKDVITQGENGYLIPPMDEHQFAEKINTTLLNGLDDLSENARFFVQNHFAWNMVADQYIGFLREVIERYSMQRLEK